MELRARPGRAGRLVVGFVLCLGASAAGGVTAVPTWEQRFAQSVPGQGSGDPLATRQLADGSVMVVVIDGAGLSVIRYGEDGVRLSVTSIVPSWPVAQASQLVINTALSVVDIDPFGLVAVASRTPDDDVWAMKYDGFTGRPLWAQSAFFRPTPQRHLPRSVHFDDLGNVIVGVLSQAGYYVVKFDGEYGDLLWQSIPLPFTTRPTSRLIDVDAIGNVYVSLGSVNVVTFMLNGLTGSVQWGPVVFDAASQDDSPRAITLDGAGGLLVTAAASVSGTSETATLKYDTLTGALVWGPVYEQADGGSQPDAIFVDSFGNPVVAGWRRDSGVVSQMAVKYSGANGSRRWGVSTGPAGSTSTRLSLEIAGNGDVLLSAYRTGLAELTTWSWAGLTGTPLRPPDTIPESFSNWFNEELIPPVTLVTSENKLLRSYQGTTAATPASATLAIDALSGLPAWGPDLFLGAAKRRSVMTDLAVGSDGHPVVVGYVSTQGFEAIATIKYNRTTGAPIWGPVFLDPINSRIDVEIGPDNNPVLWSGTSAQKLNGETGAVVWGPVDVNVYGFSRPAIDASNDVALVGSETVNGVTVDLAVAKLSGSTGQLLWGPVILDTNPGQDSFGQALISDSAGNVIVAGKFFDLGTTWIAAKLDSNDGTLIWGPVLTPGAGGFGPREVALDASENPIVVGSAGDYQFAAMKYDGATGQVLWGPVVEENVGEAYDVVLDSSGNAFVSGTQQVEGTGYDYAVVKYAGATGARLWGPVHYAGAGNFDQAFYISLDSDGHPVVSGESETARFDHDVVTFKYSSTDGSTIWGPIVAGGDGDQTVLEFDARNQTVVVAGTDVSEFRTIAYVETLGIATLPKDLPPAICGVTYNYQLASANGTGPETWSVISGTLPPGVNLESSGTLLGDPNTEGIYSFRVRLQAGGVVERDFTIFVGPAFSYVPLVAAPLPGCDLQLSVPGNWPAYQWLPGGETTPAITVRPEANTTYGVLLSDFTGCFRRGWIRVSGTALKDPACDAPTLTSVTPDSGPATGGTAVTLLGTDFDAPDVYIGNTIAPSAMVSDQELTATTASMLPGTLNHVLVRNADGGSAAILRAFFADFLDVDQAHPFHEFIETIVRAQVTAGCGGGNYCPDAPVTRAQMAVFLLVSKNGPGYTPPPATGTVFNDVGQFDFAAAFIEALAAAQVTAGCGGGNYCPNDPLTREQMAIFLLRTLEGPTYVPPSCTVPTFTDVPCSSPFARWIEEIYDRGITAGCGGGLYCPLFAVSRGQMAVFLTETFGLP